MNIQKFGDGLIKTFEEYVKKQLEVLNLKMEIFETRLKNLKDGKDGRDGRDGRDALDLKIEEDIDFNKNYVKGTLATFNNGLYYSVKNTDGKDGWKCLIDGINKIDFELSDDNRTSKIKMEKSSGEIFEKEFKIPALLYKNIYKENEVYSKNDCITFAGSLWVSKKDNNSERPGTNPENWVLCVKKGRDLQNNNKKTGE